MGSAEGGAGVGKGVICLGDIEGLMSGDITGGAVGGAVGGDNVGDGKFEPMTQ